MMASADEFRPKGFDSYHIALGDMLRGERATIGKSLQDVQGDIKINTKYIAAIEAGDLSVFETKGFIAGYVRSYARYLNLDSDKAYAQFCSETGFDGFQNDAGLRRTPAVKNHRTMPGALSYSTNVKTMGPITLPTQRWFENISFSAIGSLLVLILLVSGLGYGGWWVLQEVQRVQFAPVNNTPGVATQISVLSDGGKATDTSPDLSRTAALTLDQLYRPQELDLPSVISRDGPIATINPETQGAFAPTPPIIVPASVSEDIAVATIDLGPPPVDIVATRPAWIRIYLPDNSVLFEKILNTGERYRLPSKLDGPLLKAGNSSAVYLMVGNKTFGPVGSNGGVARKVSLSQTDIESTYKEVLNLFSAPLAPPLNLRGDKTAEAILKDLQND